MAGTHALFLALRDPGPSKPPRCRLGVANRKQASAALRASPPSAGYAATLDETGEC